MLTWRLGNRESPPEPSFPSERRQSIIGDAERDMSSLVRNRPRLSLAPNNDAEAKEVQNARALQVLSRVKDKLTGRDFKGPQELKHTEQVERLIKEATNLENLCQHYIGWCSFW